MCMIGMLIVLHLIGGILLLMVVDYTVSDPVPEYEGTQLTINESTVLQFTCSTMNEFLGCTVEFLVNKRTYDDIRSRNNTCYHKDGICQPDRCKCSKDCKGFTWNFTAMSDNVNSTFGCGSRIQENGKTYKANTSLQWTGSDFIILQKTFILINMEIKTTGFPSVITESNSSSTDYFVGSLVSLIISAVFLMSTTVLVFTLRKRRKDKASNTKMKQPKSKPRPLSLSELAQHRQDRNDDKEVAPEYELQGMRKTYENSVEASHQVVAVHEPHSRDSDNYTNIRNESKQVCTEKRVSDQSEKSRCSSGISVISSEVPFVKKHT